MRTNFFSLASLLVSAQALFLRDSHDNLLEQTLAQASSSIDITSETCTLASMQSSSAPITIDFSEDLVTMPASLSQVDVGAGA